MSRGEGSSGGEGRSDGCVKSVNDDELIGNGDATRCDVDAVRCGVQQKQKNK